MESAPVSMANGYPAPGGTAVMEGTLTTKPFGPGTVTDHVTVTGQIAPNVFAINGTEIARFKDGTAPQAFYGTVTVNEDGSQTVRVRGYAVRGGTGRYKNTAGRWTFTGTMAPGSTTLTGRSKGSFTT
jgi:hypothetical protein